MCDSVLKVSVSDLPSISYLFSNTRLTVEIVDQVVNTAMDNIMTLIWRNDRATNKQVGPGLIELSKGHFRCTHSLHQWMSQLQSAGNCQTANFKHVSYLACFICAISVMFFSVSVSSKCLLAGSLWHCEVDVSSMVYIALSSSAISLP